MAFFKKIFEGKPLKRIELKAGTPKFRLRLSRTGGANAAVHPLRGLTFNTKHGLRVSKTFKGLTLGFQRSNTVVRGRWSTKDGLLNLNLSKSGFSISGSTKWGTYNFKNPNRSSFKFAGYQIRGEKAKGLALIFLIPQLIIAAIAAIPALMQLAISIFQFLINFVLILIKVILNVFIWLIKFSILIGVIFYEFLMYLFVDIPRLIYLNKSILFYLLSLVIKTFHWICFLTSTMVVFLMSYTALVSEMTLRDSLIYLVVGVLIFFGFSLLGWFVRHVFLEDCRVFPFLKIKNIS